MKAAFVSSDAESADIKTYRFKPESPIDYTAGQFIELTLFHPHSDDRGERRWFTLSSSPAEPLLAITMRFSERIKHSSFKQSLENLVPGDVVSVSDPLGDFVLPLSTAIPLVWVANGIGITPFRSMAKWLHDSNEQRSIKLFYNVRTTQDMIFLDEFSKAGITTHPFVQSEQQQLTFQDHIRLVSHQPESMFYLAGSQELVTEITNGLITGGVSDQHIVTDVFLGY